MSDIFNSDLDHVNKLRFGLFVKQKIKPTKVAIFSRTSSSCEMQLHFELEKGFSEKPIDSSCVYK